MSVDGYGPARIDMTAAEASAALGVELRAPGALREGRLECYFVSPDGDPTQLGFMLDGGRIVRVDVRAPGIASDRGIEVGASEDAVRGAHPDVETAPHKYIDGGHYLTVPIRSDARIVFETDGAVVTSFRAGRLPQVGWVEGCL